MASGGKAAVRLAVQKEVFTPSEERLLGLAAVTKPGRKKKVSYLCVSVNLQEKPPRVVVSRIKREEPRKDKQTDKLIYHRVRKWELSELRLVDGKSSDTEVPEFDLHFEKATFKWVASNVAEKKAFVVCLYKMVHKYITRNKPEFVHIDEERLQELLVTSEAGGRGREVGEEEVVQQEEYQELTEREQADLHKMLKEEEGRAGTESASGIQDVEAFMGHLSQQLAHLDEANIHTLMDSETQIHSLMTRIDKTVLEIQQMEMKLSVYDELLGTVRANMNKLSKDYTAIMIWDRNLKALLSQVTDIVDKLYLDPRVESVLRNSKLTGDSNIRDCTKAVKDLHRVMSQQLSQGVQIMQAVSDQKNYFSELSFEFGRRLQENLCMMFSHKSTVLNDAVTQRHISLPSLPSHGPVHSEFMKYSELMRWMRDCENQRFVEVCEAYCVEFKRVYDNQIKAFMADVKSMMGRPVDTKKGPIGSLAGGLSRIGSTTDLPVTVGQQREISNLGSPSLRHLSTSLMDFSHTPKQTALGVGGDPEKPRYDQVFLLVLDQLQPLCLSEEKFCNSFFHFPKQETSQSPPDSGHTSPTSNEGQEETDGLQDFFGLMSKRQHKDTIEVGIMGLGVNGLLQQLFQCLLSELETLINFGERIDQFNSLYLLVSVSQRVMFAREGGKLSYLDKCLDNSLLVLKRLFVKLVTTKEVRIRDCKIPRKGGKCGILPCVTEFADFAERAERIMMGYDSRMELDKAYEALNDALSSAIDRLAEEHPKTPRNVVMFENYHTLYDKLSHLKITCLEKAREEAKQRNRTNQQEYVITCLGKPLEKLSSFFEGVERLLASGVKAEQIGFYRDYSKGELVKCIQAYPGKEVKKGLEKLYRRIERDLTEEVGLLRVIWGSMQKAFMEQYQHFTKLIEKCYPGSNIELEFGMQEIMIYFQTISD